MNIKNKAESDYTISKLGLNRIADRLYTQDNLIELEEYLNDNKDLVYNIRDKSSAMGKFRYKLTADEVLEIAHTYEKFSVYESLHEVDKNLILQGDISLDKQFNLLASLDNTKNISNRQAMTNPRYTVEQ
ncbi:MAG TPA: hypothetical protein GXZ90_03115, partial [Clostridiales bacterium]|nr:hypothetical protein [Clostridiales bacterium]